MCPLCGFSLVCTVFLYTTWHCEVWCSLIYDYTSAWSILWRDCVQALTTECLWASHCPQSLHDFSRMIHYNSSVNSLIFFTDSSLSFMQFQCPFDHSYEWFILYIFFAIMDAKHVTLIYLLCNIPDFPYLSNVSIWIYIIMIIYANCIFFSGTRGSKVEQWLMSFKIGESVWNVLWLLASKSPP